MEARRPATVARSGANFDMQPKEVTRPELIEPAPRTETAAISQTATHSGSLTSLLAASLPCSAERRASQMRELRQAGLHGVRAWERLAAVRHLGVMIPLTVFGVLMILVPAQYELLIGVLLASSCLLGWTLPWQKVRRMARDRSSAISRGLPDLIDLVAASVRQGVGLQRSLEEAGRSLQTAYPALAEEIGVVCRQARVDTLERALRRFGDCFDADGVRTFAALVADAQQLGADVSQALFEQSAELREERRLQADRALHHALVRQAIAICVFLVPACCLLLWACFSPESLAALIG